jgi:glutamate transport system permease protein
MNNKNITIRDYLYEAPGPKTKRYITIGTVLSLICVAWLIYVIIRLFYENGQLDAKYWSIFTRATTWRFFGKGLLGTLEVSLTAMLVTFSLGMIMMIGRINRNKVISTIATVFIELSR